MIEITGIEPERKKSPGELSKRQFYSLYCHRVRRAYVLMQMHYTNNNSKENDIQFIFIRFTTFIFRLGIVH